MKHPKKLYCKACIVLMAVLFIAPLSLAGHSTSKTVHSELSKQLIASKIEALNSREGLDKSEKSKILAIYQNTLDNLINSDSFKARASEYDHAIKYAPDKTQALQREIEQAELKLGKSHEADSFANIGSAELEQRLIIEKGKLSNIDSQLNKLKNDLIIQNNRLQQIRQESSSAQQDLDDNHKALQTPANRKETKLALEARELFLKSDVEAKTNEQKMLEYEAISNPARVELIKSEIKLLTLQKNQLAPMITAIELLIAERREQEAKDMEDIFAQTEKELAGKPLAIQKISRENISYSRELQAIAGKIDGYIEQKNRIETLVSDLDSDFKSAEKKITLAEISPALGKVLREQRRNLPTPDDYSKQTQLLQNETAKATLEEFKIEDQQKQIENSDSALKNIIDSEVEASLPADQRMMIQAQLRILLDGKKDLLNKLAVSNANYVRALGDYGFAKDKLLAISEKFAIYLDERLLWVPSSEPINSYFVQGIMQSLKWLISPNNWQIFVKDTFDTADKLPFLFVVTVLVCLLVSLTKSWAQKNLERIAKSVNSFTQDSFQLTLNALALTLLLVLPIPLAMYLFGKIIISNAEINDFSEAIANGLIATAMPLLFLMYAKCFFASNGLASQHFYWSKNYAQLLYRQILWLRIAVVPSLFIIACTSASKTTLYSDTLGRFGLIVDLVASTVLFVKLLRPSGSFIRQTVTNNPESWLAKTRYFWFPVLVLAPIIVIGFASAGYYLSALELQQKMIISLRWVFTAIFIHALVFRWLSLVNRQLAIANVKQKNKIRHQHDKHVAGSEDSVLVFDEHQVDIPKINAQTKTLLNVFICVSLIISFGVIWKNILPAFSFLDQIVLWQYLATDDNPKNLQSVTLTNLMLSGFYLFAVGVAVRNFSGVIELVLFRHLEMDAGSRYAINQLAKYCLVTVGLISVANELGGSWAQVQWLVAAVGVGLGFGLQEIFANLVSGIILLFERPLRIGDTVTIGEITGKVSKIQMRATTVTDWDHKELIVPNKSFITNPLVNWTLSSAVTRVASHVGVAYGSNLDLTHDIILKAVKSTPHVLAEPEPSVLFLGFGNSSINFTIYFFVNDFTLRLPVTHDLNMRVENALRQNNITIPFPQTDVHLHYAGRKKTDT